MRLVYYNTLELHRKGCEYHIFYVSNVAVCLAFFACIIIPAPLYSVTRQTKKSKAKSFKIELNK